MDPFSFLGWLGAALILIAYILLQAGKLLPSDRSYDLMNLFGGLAIAVNTFHTETYGPMVLNIIWAMVAGIGLFSLKHSRAGSDA